MLEGMLSHGIGAAVLLVGAAGILLASRVFWVTGRSSRTARATADNDWRNEQYSEHEHEHKGEARKQPRFTTIWGDQMNTHRLGLWGGLSVIVLACLAL